MYSTMKPILFNTEMVQAILDDRKTSTRRIVDQDIANSFDIDVDGTAIAYMDQATGDSHPPESVAPYKLGDILYVRETWQHAYDMDGNDQFIEGTGRYLYAASPEEWPHFSYWVDSDTGEHKDRMPWRPSIHMPKEAARLFLRVTGVRAERLQDITAMDVKAEGLHTDWFNGEMERWNIQQRAAFQKLWNSLYSKPRPVKCRGVIVRYESYPWEDIQEAREYKGLPWRVIGNPWVWAYTFEK